MHFVLIYRRFILIAIFVIGVFALWWTLTKPPAGSSAVSGKHVAIEAWGPDLSKPVRRYDLGDSESIRVLQSMFVPDAKRKTNVQMPRHSQYSMEFRPSKGVVSFMQTIEIWKTSQGMMWSKGDGTYRVFGDLELFLRAMPACRLAQILVSRDLGEYEEAKRIRSARIDEFVDALLALCASENEIVRTFALHTLTMLIRSNDSGAMYGRRPVERDRIGTLTPAVQERIRMQILRLLQITTDESATSSLVFQCLKTIHDQTTADELASLLTKETHVSMRGKLIECLEAVYGLPPTYERVYMCGNSSPEDFARYRKMMDAREMEGRKKLLGWHQAHAQEPRDIQLDSILEQWNDRLLSLGESRQSHNHEAIPSAHFIPLLRLGVEIVPALERRQQRTSDLIEKGALEFIRAYLTGACNAPIVNELLAGNMRQQILACNVIAVSGGTEWQSQLDRFQYVPLPKDDPKTFHDVLALRSAATAALLTAHGVEALSLIEAAHDAGFGNSQTEQALRFYTMPSERMPVPSP